ncbi:hypothetical protein L6R52_27795 [Myxococcota bacterium]|nr:hypothetical protein [Myxococcota bacterium]
MLDAYIIDAIRDEELERERAFERRRVFLELPIRPDPRRRDDDRRRDEPDAYDPVIIPLTPEIPIREDDAA